MSDKPKHATFEELLEGNVYTTCLLNEPLDFTVDFAVKGESATARALRIWFKQLEEEKHYD